MREASETTADLLNILVHFDKVEAKNTQICNIGLKIFAIYLT